MAATDAILFANKARIGDSALAARLRREIEGAVLFDPFSRGRYSTDASHYQIEPIGIVVPKTTADIHRVIQIAADEGLPVLPRGGGTSQCGQTVGEAIVVDVAKHLNGIVEFDPDARRITVEPGLVLDRLNQHLAPHKLMFPVDVSTSSRATIGGMTGNNSCGARLDCPWHDARQCRRHRRDPRRWNRDAFRSGDERGRTAGPRPRPARHRRRARKQRSPPASPI